jgi:hypothetical protein
MGETQDFAAVGAKIDKPFSQERAKLPEFDRCQTSVAKRANRSCIVIFFHIDHFYLPYSLFISLYIIPLQS